jgi:hypothetical protein
MPSQGGLASALPVVRRGAALPWRTQWWPIISPGQFERFVGWRMIGPVQELQS